MSIPDVEQFLAVMPSGSRGIGGSNVGDVSVGTSSLAHPMLVRHADSPAQVAAATGVLGAGQDVGHFEHAYAGRHRLPIAGRARPGQHGVLVRQNALRGTRSGAARLIDANQLGIGNGGSRLNNVHTVLNR